MSTCIHRRCALIIIIIISECTVMSTCTLCIWMFAGVWWCMYASHLIGATGQVMWPVSIYKYIYIYIMRTIILCDVMDDMVLHYCIIWHLQSRRRWRWRLLLYRYYIFIFIIYMSHLHRAHGDGCYFIFDILCYITCMYILFVTLHRAHGDGDAGVERPAFIFSCI